MVEVNKRMLKAWKSRWINVRSLDGVIDMGDKTFGWKQCGLMDSDGKIYFIVVVEDVHIWRVLFDCRAKSIGDVFLAIHEYRMELDSLKHDVPLEEQYTKMGNVET